MCENSDYVRTDRSSVSPRGRGRGRARGGGWGGGGSTGHGRHPHTHSRGHHPLYGSGYTDHHNNDND